VTAAPKGILGWPAAERPRERLFARGPHALSDAELLALLLRTGRPGASAVDLARELLREAGGLRRLADRLPAELRRLGLGAAKAAAVVAGFELGRRMLAEPDRPRPRFTCSADVWRHFGPRRAGRRREVFEIALLDSAHRLIASRTITVGTLNLALVHPRDVFREAIAESAAGLVLIHNHPSGDPAPSEEDVKLTRQLVRAGEAVGIPVLDHIILGAGRWFSFADSRRLSA
jgi:DNA repair protein RadC